MFIFDKNFSMSNIINEVEKFVYNLLSEKLHANYVYHNLSHTQRVVEKTIEISEDSNIKGDDLENLTIAAWFHDVGFTVSDENHEEESIKIASEFLKSLNFSSNS